MVAIFVWHGQGWADPQPLIHQTLDHSPFCHLRSALHKLNFPKLEHRLSPMPRKVCYLYLRWLTCSNRLAHVEPDSNLCDSESR